MGPATCGTLCSVDANGPDMEAQDGGPPNRPVSAPVLRLYESIGSQLRSLRDEVLESFEQGASLLCGRHACGHHGSCCPRVHRKDRRDNSQGSKSNQGIRYSSEMGRLERMSPGRRGTGLNQHCRKIDRKQAAILPRKEFVHDQGGNTSEDAHGRSLGVPQAWRDAAGHDPVRWMGLSAFLHFKR